MIGVAPVISRIFAPDVFGLAAVFTALVFLLTTLATLRFDQAIIVADSDRDVAGLARLTLIVLTLFSLAAFLLAAVLLTLDVPLGKFSALSTWLLLVPAGIFLTGLSQLLRGRLVRHKHFGKVARGEIILASGSATARVGGGLTLGATLGILVGGQLLGMLARVLYLAIGVRRVAPPVAAQDRPGIRQLVRSYRQFPLYATPTAFLRSFSDNLPLLALGMLYAPAVAGFYAFARRLMMLPGTMINMAIRQVYLQKAAEMHNAGRGTRGPLLKTTGVLLCIGVPLTAALMLFGEPLFGLLLGQRWTTAGLYAEIVSPWLLFSVASAPAAATYVVYRRQRRLLGIQIVMTSVRLLIVLYAYLKALAVVPLLILLTGASVLGFSLIMLNGFIIAGRGPAQDAPQQSIE